METSLYVVFLLFLRAIGVLSLLPVGGAGISAVLQKSTLALGLAILGYPWVERIPEIQPSSLAVEFLIGLSLGIPLALAVSSAQMWGELFDSARGQNMALILDPQSQHQLSPGAVLFRHLSWSAILAAGGLLLLLRAYLHGVITAPPGFQELSQDWAMTLMLLLSQTVQATMVLALPAAVLCVSVELAAAFCVRAMPQLHLGSEVFIVKCGLGWLFVWHLHSSGELAALWALRVPL